MRTHLALVALLSIAPAASALADDWQPEAGFRSLFNGRDLAGWCFRAGVDRTSPGVGDVAEKFDGKASRADRTALTGPAPQHRSRMTGCGGATAVACSARNSVRRRGTNTPGATAMRSPQNCAQPSTYSSGSPFTRRTIQASSSDALPPASRSRAASSSANTQPAARSRSTIANNEWEVTVTAGPARARPSSSPTTSSGG